MMKRIKISLPALILLNSSGNWKAPLASVDELSAASNASGRWTHFKWIKDEKFLTNYPGNHFNSINVPLMCNHYSAYQFISRCLTLRRLRRSIRAEYLTSTRSMRSNSHSCKHVFKNWGIYFKSLDFLGNTQMSVNALARVVNKFISLLFWWEKILSVRNPFACWGFSCWKILKSQFPALGFENFVFSQRSASKRKLIAGAAGPAQGSNFASLISCNL